ncbi:autotransporter domain-containing protein [Ensifer canadensis]
MLRETLLDSTALGRIGFLSVVLAAATIDPSAGRAAGLVIEDGDVVWTQNRTVAGYLVVRGDADGASLTIKDGAAVASEAGYIGDGRGTVGTVVVSGAGSTWDIVTADPTDNRLLYIGGFDTGIQGGKGTLIIENGGRVSSQYVNLGALQGGDGTLIVRGEGSMLSTDHLNVAYASHTLNYGEVFIQDGGLITSKNSILENGRATVSGANSRWINSGSFNINDTFTIENGGVVTTGTADLTKNDSTDLVTVYVNGAGSELAVNGKLSIAETGAVNLSVANGAKLSAAGGIFIAGSGNVFQEGMGSLTIGGKVEMSRIIGATGLEAQAAGHVDPAAGITFGSGDGHLNFNHTNSGYDLANIIAGKGTINSLAGETVLSGDLAKFNGNVNVLGGKLVLKGNIDTSDNDGNANDRLYYSETRFDVKDGTLIVDGEAGRVQTTSLGGKAYTNSVIVWGETLNRIGKPTSTAFGRLGGSGTIGTTAIDKRAVIAPGNNSTGTLTIMGQLEMSDGSIYEADIAGDGRSDRIAVRGLQNGVQGDGVATIGNGVNVEVTALNANTSYQNGQTYTILTAENGVDGRFAQAISKSAFLDVTLEHKDKQVDLKIAIKDMGTPNPGNPNPGNPNPGNPNPGNPNPGNPNPGNPNPGTPGTSAKFERVAINGNQRNTALALNTLAQSGPSLALYNTLLGLDTANARGAFERLSGEVHASAKTALINDSNLLRNAASDRIRDAFGDVAAANVPVLAYGPEDKITTGAVGAINAVAVPPPAMVGWGQVFGSWINTDGNGNTGQLDQSTGGFITGFDAAVSENALVGIMAGYSRTNFDVDSRASSGDSDNYHLGVYGGGRWGDVALRSGLAYTWHSIKAERVVVFPGFRDELKADYDAGTFQAFGEVGYRIDLPSVALEPFANLAYVSLHTDGFTERGAAAALSSRSNTTDTTFTTLGLRASAPLGLGATEAKVRGMLGWQHAFGDTSPLSTMAFGTGSAFSVAGTPIAEDAAIIEAGIDFALTGNASLGITYTGQFGSDTTQNAVDAKLGVRF